MLPEVVKVALKVDTTPLASPVAPAIDPMSDAGGTSAVTAIVVATGWTELHEPGSPYSVYAVRR